MKITEVTYNNRKRSFQVHANGKLYDFPYAKLESVPARGNTVVGVYTDPDFGHEAFTYSLKDGEEGSVHIDHVLEVNRDPDYMAELLLYKLTIEAQRRISTSELSKREVIRRLGTSAAQFYRLMDPSYSRKSVNQMLGLLHLLGCEVDVYVKDARAESPKKLLVSV